MTFSPEVIAQVLTAGDVIVFSIRPPQKKDEGWAVNFRQRHRETVWNYGDQKPTLEEAVMNTLEKIEALLANKKITHVAFGRTTVPGPTRFASIEDSDRGFHRGTGNTVSEAADAAMAAAEKALSGKRGGPKKQEVRYFWHPESNCVFTTDDGSRPVGDGLVEEVDKAVYLKLKAQIEAETSDPLANLLG